MKTRLVRPMQALWSRLKPVHPPWLPADVCGVLSLGIVVTTLLLGVRSAGVLQSLELRAFDRMVRWRSDERPDPRLLIVGITEDDLRHLKRPTPSDQTLAWALQKLQAHQPALIGLDLHRDVPQHIGRLELIRQLQADNIIVITKLGDTTGTEIPPPSEVKSAERIGFNDFIVDSDGVIRRSLLFGSTSDGTLYYSFSLRLALAYLAKQEILPRSSDRNADHLRLGKSTFVPLNADSGGYQTVDDRGYQILLNYRSRQEVARQVSFVDVLLNRVDADWIRGKIVLVGTVAPSGKDLFYTPYSAGEQVHHRMAGVAVHGQMVSQILDAALNERPLFWFWPEWLEIGWIILWASIGGTAAWRIRHALLLSTVSGVAIAVLCGVSFLVFLHQGWIPIAAPAIAMIATGSTTVAYRAQQAQRQQQMVMSLLGQNTSPEVARALWENRDNLLDSGKLPGQELTATLLFTDLKNFSTIAEQMPPEALLSWLNEYLSAMTEEIQAHHGIINKFTGDGLLAVFGVPVARTQPEEIAQDAQHAVSCALAMGDRLQQLNRDWQTRQLPAAQMRVGIFTGPIVAGSLGGKHRLEYGVIGDSVNIAARLESCEKDRHAGICRILLTDRTLMYLQQSIQVERWGLLALKGRQQPVEVYQVVSPSSPKEDASIVPHSSIGQPNLSDSAELASPE